MLAHKTDIQYVSENKVIIVYGKQYIDLITKVSFYYHNCCYKRKQTGEKMPITSSSTFLGNLPILKVSSKCAALFHPESYNGKDQEE